MDWSASELELLGRLFLFRGLSRTELVHALEGVPHYQKDYAKGQAVYRPRAYERSMGVLLSGAVEVTKENEPGNVMIVSVLSAGDAFGGAALFNECEDYVTTITARTEVRILFLPQAAVSLLIQDPRIAENYIRYLSGRIRFLSGKIDSLIAGSAERKVAQYLLSRLEGECVRLDCSLSGLADRLHIGRASLYRSLDSMEDSGILTRSGRCIRVLDRNRLALV